MKSQREFAKLLAGVFVSQSGSHFLTLAISSFVFMATGSITKASMVFVATFFPAVFVSAPLGNFADKYVSRKVLCGTEILSIILTIIAAIALYYQAPIGILCVIMAFRAIFLLLGRALVSKWLKVISTPEEQPARFKLYSLSFFLSTAFSGVLAGMVLRHASIPVVAMIDVISYMVGVLIYLSLRPLPAEPVQTAAASVRLWQSIKDVLVAPRLRQAFFFVVVSQAFFQGAYSVLVSYLPLKRFELGLDGVGIFQMAASFGITMGFFLLWRKPQILAERHWSFPAKSLSLFAMGIALLVFLSRSEEHLWALGAFAGMNFLYECIWLQYSADFFRSSPKIHAARFNFLLSSCASFAMSVTTLAYAYAIEHLGLSYGVITVVSVAILMGAFKIVNSLPTEGQQGHENA